MRPPPCLSGVLGFYRLCPLGCFADMDAFHHGSGGGLGYQHLHPREYLDEGDE